VLCELLRIPESDPLYTPFAPSLYPPRHVDHDDRPPLARAFVQVAGMDPLRDHGLVYERALREEWAVETKLKVYEGFGHMFWTNWPEMEASQAFYADLKEGMRWLLRQ
jgi:acetyl esterase/lipase